MKNIQKKEKETEFEKLSRQYRGYKNLQSFMLESDEKAEKRKIIKRLEELGFKDW